MHRTTVEHSASPDEVRSFPKAHVETVHIAAVTRRRAPLRIPPHCA
jgi:hypothetical protein